LVVLAGVAVAVAAGDPPLVLLIAAAAAEGCLTVIFNLAALSAVQLLVPPRQREPALAQNEARFRGAGLLGQPLGGALFGLGRAVAFGAEAVSLRAPRRHL